MSTIGEQIKLRRTEKELSLTELAKRVDISKGYLHSIESGATRNPSAEVLFRIANELGTTIADLLDEEEPFEDDSYVDIPDSLAEFAKDEELPEADIIMLARIEYRGKKPQSPSDWRFIYESIKRSVKDD
jgi:transcriptional regulator with XRE-family HTH domain